MIYKYISLVLIFLSLLFYAYHLRCFKKSNLFFSGKNIEIPNGLIDSDFVRKNFFNTHPKFGSLKLKYSKNIGLSLDDRLNALHCSYNENPLDIETLAQLGELYLKEKKMVDSSIHYLRIANKKQSNYYRVNLLLSEAYLQNDDFYKARVHLNRAYHPWYKTQIYYLEALLYQSKYLNQLLSIDSSFDFDIYHEQHINVDQNIIKKSVYVEIANHFNLIEKSMFNLIGQDSYKIYLKELLECRVDYKSDVISQKFNLSESSKILLREIILNYDIEREYYRRSLRIDKLNSSQILHKKNIIDSLTKTMVLEVNTLIPEFSTTNLEKSDLNWNWYFQSER